MKIEIALKTYVHLLLIMLMGYLLYALRFEFILFYLALIVAMTLYSAESYLEKNGIRRKYSMPFLIILYLGVISSIVFFVVPTVVNQVMDISQNFGQIKQKIFSLPHFNDYEKNIKDYFSNSPELLSGVRNYVTEIGKQTLSGLLSIGIFIVVSLYIYIDGSRSYKWIRKHFNDGNKAKLDQTIKDINPIMTAYVFGQALTSTAAAIVVYLAAIILKIPAAMTLAVFAAIFDILPGVGLIIIIIVSAILSLVVSVKATITMVIILICYHLIESYLLTPYIYGNRMKISPLVVLSSLIFAGTIAGVQGMIAILPIVAAYPTIEKIWLPQFFRN